jgi:cytochrome c-type biogenesis protein CcmH
MSRLILAAPLLLWAAIAQAVLPHERLADPVLEARAREISKDLRCQVCQNQSIDDSNAPLAADLRKLVRERLTAGDSNDQVMGFIVARYGDYVRLTPPMRMDTLLLWGAPAIVLLAAVLGLALRMRRRDTAQAGVVGTPLSDDEKRAFERLLARETRESRKP